MYSRENQTAFLPRDLTEFRAHLLVSVNVLEAKTHDFDQFRQNDERLCLGNEQFRRLRGSLSQQIETLGHNPGRASAALESSQATHRREVAPFIGGILPCRYFKVQ